MAAVGMAPQNLLRQEFFEMIMHAGPSVALTEKEDGVDALMLANAVSPNRFSESELMRWKDFYRD